MIEQRHTRRRAFLSTVSAAGAAFFGYQTSLAAGLRFDFKGLPLYSSVEQARQWMVDNGSTSWTCTVPADAPNQHVCVATGLTFGNAPVLDVVMSFENDRLILVSVGLHARDFDSAIAQLRKRYGAPSSSRQRSATNGLGLEIPQHEVVWRAPDGSAVLGLNPSESVRRSSISIVAPEARQPPSAPSRRKPDV